MQQAGPHQPASAHLVRRTGLPRPAEPVMADSLLRAIEAFIADHAA